MRPALSEIPDGYVVHRVADAWLLFDRAHARALVELRLADPRARRELFARAPRRGRGAAPSVSAGPELSLVLRRYRHGGLLGGLLGPLYLGPQRALAELAVTAAAERSGAPVPHVLCLVVWRVAGPLWSALIGTQEIAAGRDLAATLADLHGSRERVQLARAVGAALRRLHDAGVDHRDLQLRNVLVAGGSLERIVVVDLDRARMLGGIPLASRARARNLGRLVRSAVKLGAPLSGSGRRELAALLAAYTRGERALRQDLLRFAGWERCKLALHRASYGLRRVRPPLRAASPPRPA
jgi:3-deoxy-D-manno-octulosonic acid kinase